MKKKEEKIRKSGRGWVPLLLLLFFPSPLFIFAPSPLQLLPSVCLTQARWFANDAPSDPLTGYISNLFLSVFRDSYFQLLLCCNETNLDKLHKLLFLINIFLFW